jgi:Immunity protein 42
MIVGNSTVFAIEHRITHAYARLSFRALGCFLIHIEGQSYGVSKPDATMLAASFDEVEQRIARRGTHLASFSTVSDASQIADAYCEAIYAPDKENQRFFDILQPEFQTLFYSNHIAWAPDGDEAFDDGSHVLHFDFEDRVRLIGFRFCNGGYNHDPKTLSDVWLKADEFYRVLQRWHDTFEAEWAAAPKK